MVPQSVITTDIRYRTRAREVQDTVGQKSSLCITLQFVFSNQTWGHQEQTYYPGTRCELCAKSLGVFSANNFCISTHKKYMTYIHMVQPSTTASAGFVSHHGPLTRYAKLRVVHAPGMPGTFSRYLQRKPLVSHPGVHHGECVTHVPWCMWGSLTHGCSGENGPGLPGACTTRNFTCLSRDPFPEFHKCSVCLHPVEFRAI